MKPDTIKTGAMPATARDSARICGNDTANLPNDLGKFRKEKKSWAALVADVGRVARTRQATCDRWIFASCNVIGWHWTLNGEEVASIQMRTEVDRVILNYRSRSNGGEWQPMEYPVYLEWTPCHLGGRRAWFLCPARGCGRRVAILFGGSIFACRHCHKLAYACQRETDDDRAMRRADTIRRRLGWGAGIANPEGGKPKGMHWRTFEWLKAEHDAFANASCMGMAERLGLMNRRLVGLGLEPLDDLGRDG